MLGWNGQKSIVDVFPLWTDNLGCEPIKQSQQLFLKPHFFFRGGVEGHNPFQIKNSKIVFCISLYFFSSIVWKLCTKMVATSTTTKDSSRTRKKVRFADTKPFVHGCNLFHLYRPTQNPTQCCVKSFIDEEDVIVHTCIKHEFLRRGRRFMIHCPGLRKFHTLLRQKSKTLIEKMIEPEFRMRLSNCKTKQELRECIESECI